MNARQLFAQFLSHLPLSASLRPHKHTCKFVDKCVCMRVDILISPPLCLWRTFSSLRVQTDQIENQAPDAWVSHSTWVTWLKCLRPPVLSTLFRLLALLTSHIIYATAFSWVSPTHTLVVWSTHTRKHSTCHILMHAATSFDILLIVLTMPDIPIVLRSTYGTCMCIS